MIRDVMIKTVDDTIDLIKLPDDLVEVTCIA